MGWEYWTLSLPGSLIHFERALLKPVSLLVESQTDVPVLIGLPLKPRKRLDHVLSRTSLRGGISLGSALSHR